MHLRRRVTYHKVVETEQTTKEEEVTNVMEKALEAVEVVASTNTLLNVSNVIKLSILSTDVQAGRKQQTLWLRKK